MVLLNCFIFHTFIEQLNSQDILKHQKGLKKTHAVSQKDLTHRYRRSWRVFFYINDLQILVVTSYITSYYIYMYRR